MYKTRWGSIASQRLVFLMIDMYHKTVATEKCMYDMLNVQEIQKIDKAIDKRATENACKVVDNKTDIQHTDTHKRSKQSSK